MRCFKMCWGRMWSFQSLWKGESPERRNYGSRKNWKQALRKRYQREKPLKLVVILGICGIALIGLSSFWEPESTADPQESREAPVEISSDQLEQEISRLVTAITGEEDPTVVVTLEDNGRNLYASDQRESSEQEDGRASLEQENTHVLLEDSQGSQYALTVTKTQPKVKGVVVVSRMAGDPAVQEKLLTAVCTALDVSTAKVCVVGSA